MIEVVNLTKLYGRFVALDSISFTAKEAEIVGFLGPNGAGKTTAMRILTGYMPPTSGAARIAGLDVVDDSLAVRQRVGYLPETVPLYRDMTVTGYLNFVAQLRGVKKRKQRIAATLEQVGMADRARSLIRSLSKGMRQRVGLAQALIHEPDVLILDEPTIGLDPHQVQDVRALIRDLGRSQTVLLSTHILSEAEQLCDRVIILDRGHVVAEDTPVGLQDRLQRQGRLFVRVERRSAQNDVMRVIKGVQGVRKVEPQGDGYLITTAQNQDVRPALSAAIVGQGFGLLEMRAWATTLEEIFLELTPRAEQRH
ncbi:MAG TPA: ABC transporter ATP-binding protein [Aggregatilinea sp.]|uniref:ABC transporter ATP-binding protein n=1 Tax=Aggregatilinea sp. TaxID=2806333 RepID=UPI002C99F9B5|nr:ABC transporter ATP-binding protein [Aggregatilinea sp.]HML21208.1 ABC transporter ATP-binding protein [Aggregatilinea sp.]